MVTISEKRHQLECYPGKTVCPDDFLDHWKTSVEQMGRVQVRREPVPSANSGALYERLHITTAQGEEITARYLRPAQGDGPYPTLLMYHDLGRGMRGWHHMTRFVGIGYAVVALENRMDPLLLPEQMEEETLERCELDALAAAKAALCLPETDSDRLAVWGEGFGGGLAIVVAALLPQTVHCTALHPMPTELPEGWSYLDVEVFAEHLRGPLLLGTALMDEVATPWGQYACVHRANGPKRHLVYPKYGHERINAFEDEHLKQLNLWSQKHSG